MTRADREDFAAELEAHLALLTEDNIRRGLSPDAARREARLRLGGASQIAEHRHDQRTLPLFDTLPRDLRHAVRSLRRYPGFCAVVVLTLGLGIGISTATFSIVDAALFRPLGFPEPDRLVALHTKMPWAGLDRSAFSAPDFVDLAREQQSFTGAAAYVNTPFELSGGSAPTRIDAAKVSANLFSVLDVTPALGRVFRPDEDRPGVDVAVLSWELWQAQYQGDPAIVGATVMLDRRPYTVIGVMPATFEFPRRGPAVGNRPASVWVPMAFTPGLLRERGNGVNHNVVARLKKGTSIDEARAEVSVLARRIGEQYPPAVPKRSAMGMTVTPLQEEISGRMERPLLLLFAAVGLVLVVTCANVANLVLSRSAARSREIALRTALGSSRARLLQLLLAEAALLSATGALLGFVFARLVVSAVPAVVTEMLPIAPQISLDVRVLSFTTGVAIATSILFAIIPLLALERRTPGAALQEEATRSTPGTRRHRLQAGLVVSTVVLSFVLLVGAGLFIRSFAALMARDTGFNADSVLTASVVLPRAGFANAAIVRSFHTTLLAQAASLTGVRSAAITTDLPLERYERRGVSAEGVETAQSTHLSWVDGAYFSTLGIRVTSGRAFTDVENAERRGVVIVNERLARAFWAGQDAVGKRLRWGRDGNSPANRNAWLTVVGVIADVADGPLDGEPFFHAYEPFSQFPEFILNDVPTTFGRGVTLAVRTNGDPLALASAVRTAINRLDSRLAIGSMATMADRMSDVTAPRRFSAMTLGAFAGGSLLLAATGLYGLLAFMVRERRREIAVRLALGAEPRRILHMVVGRGLKLVSVGLLAGVVASHFMARAVQSLLFQTESHDLVTFATVPLVLATIAIIACALPAYRASRVEPLGALRAD
jgi:putative ABC transport system permease protein